MHEEMIEHEVPTLATVEPSHAASHTEEAPVPAIVAEVQQPPGEPCAAEAALYATLESRLRALEERLHTVEEMLKTKRAVEASAAPAPQEPRAPRMLSKGAEHAPAAAGVDAALSSLSVEQRLAVKAGLLRAGLL